MKNLTITYILILIATFTFFNFTFPNTENQISETTYSIQDKNERKLLRNIKNKELRNEVKAWLGTPYKYGSCSKKGTDCSGFVQSVMKTVYDVRLPRSSKDQYKVVNAIKKQKKLKEGDLVFFKIQSLKVSHVGIYLGDGYFVHASTKKGVVINNLEEDYYTKYFYRGGRINK